MVPNNTHLQLSDHLYHSFPPFTHLPVTRSISLATTRPAPIPLAITCKQSASAPFKPLSRSPSKPSHTCPPASNSFQPSFLNPPPTRLFHFRSISTILSNPQYHCPPPPHLPTRLFSSQRCFRLRRRRRRYIVDRGRWF